MSRRKNIFVSSAVICAFSFMCRGSGMLFRLYLASRMGSEGIGLYQLVLSVYSLFAAFANSGLTLSVSRIIAEESEKPDGGRTARHALSASFRLALIMGTSSLLLLLLLSLPLSKVLLGDARTVLPLRLLAFSMPFMALSSCFKGWFMAKERYIIPSSAQLFEDLCKIGITVGVFTLFLGDTADTGKLCAFLCAGLCAGEIFSCLYVSLFFAFSRRYRFSSGEKRVYTVGSAAKVALPVSAGGWLNSGLHTVENVLIPYCFTLYGGNTAKSLSDFGLIRGMVIPVLFFPFAFLTAVVSILIPALSRLNVDGDKSERNAKVTSTLKMTIIFSIAAGSLFFFFPNEISFCFYGDTSASVPLKILSLVTPFMYIETICDGLLKGIGEQAYTMRVTLYNCVSRILIIIFLIPRTGATGYLWLLVVSNTFSFLMCYIKTVKKTRQRHALIGYFAFPAVFSVLSGCLASRILPYFSLHGKALPAIMGCALFLVPYALLCIVFLKYADRKAV